LARCEASQFMSENLWKPESYSSHHMARFTHTLEVARKYWTVGQSVGSVGLSPFDQIAKNTFGQQNYFIIVPNRGFLRQFPPEAHRGLNVIEYDLAKAEPAPSRRFDLVIMAEVLEHLLSPDPVIVGNLKSLVNPGGHICLTVPNFVRHVNRLKVALGINPLHSKLDIVQGVMGGFGHIREYTLTEVAGLFETAFDIKELTTFNPYGTPAQRAVLRLLPKTFGSTIILIGQNRIEKTGETA